MLRTESLQGLGRRHQSKTVVPSSLFPTPRLVAPIPLPTARVTLLRRHSPIKQTFGDKCSTLLSFSDHEGREKHEVVRVRILGESGYTVRL
ncbi:MAG TPA: hypothetical protein DDX19_22115 [Rhodopirellula baltica]|uniref:Uncharacterized protein n=1 Tax=Rhodopirellula baltica (strain DSM 10527 / NCIMB 13988 / SH1) TaxID=243090 RepID=Q7UMS2_RHOBA|nr:hypothetical protein RB8630 [Rhodopirellula baltica SH 1]HBE65399.1 hypothetical protein [Rhodopirellula baltica]